MKNVAESGPKELFWSRVLFGFEAKKLNKNRMIKGV